MALFVRIVLALASAASVTQAFSLGYEQRQAFKTWREHQINQRLSSNRLASRQQTNTCNGGPNYVLSLCPNTTYDITAPLEFANKYQEISTLGYPIDDQRAVLRVNGSRADEQGGHTVAIGGGCDQCEGIQIRNIQIDGNRQGAAPISGGANIEIGGGAGGQLVDSNSTVRYNDIGPCGSDTFGHWADGISLACKDSAVYENWIKDPTDGGIVIFQSPGSLIENNTIWIENNTCLGGINLVDYDPFAGNYTGVMFANNTENAIIKIGLAVGLRVWFGTKWGDATAFGASVIGNKISGAFGFGMAVSGVNNFTILNNSIAGNTSFIGAKGPNCTTDDIVPPAVDFVVDPNTFVSSKIGGTVFKAHGITALLCVTPPRGGGNVWPLGTWPSSSSLANQTVSTPSTETPASSWCLQGEDKRACLVRFAKDLLGIAIVFAKQK
ncbi:Right handed beta helix region [Rhizoctonia solani]|uniref:Right handed beta helix region n=1 Tax=Rhizoctonia solani TaxID=456999 RepID=A0A8H7ILY1_9AGAM|nr:Right handed beta helix region [Rhizoctonia solani]